jgi:hypothetical protein
MSAGAYEGLKRILAPLELELQVAVTACVGAGKQAWILWKSSEWLQLLSLCSCSLRSSVSVGFIVYCLQSKRSPEWTASQWLGQAMAAVQVLQPILDGRRRDGSACVASEDGSLWVEGVR